jgi:acyl-CoA synthetase (AMP-forming)/AMP-acid ligase II
MPHLFELVNRHAEWSESKVAVSKWRPGGVFVEASYGALLRKARRLAALFARLAPPAAIVPMVTGRSADSIAAMLGAIAAARPFCFLNTKYRGPQIAAVLDATGSALGVVDAAGLVTLRSARRDHPQIARMTWVVLEEPALAGIYAEAAEDLRRAANVIFLCDEHECADTWIERPPHAGANAAAACLFTSGSTGQPKGVLISEADVMGRVAAEVNWYSLTQEDVLLNILPFSFDVGLNQLMTALAVGGEIVLLDSWLPADILATVERRRVTGISAVPSIWQDMINGGVHFDKGGRHASLRYITISGGSLSPEYLQRLSSFMGGVAIFKTYGQTEAFRATSLRPEEYDKKLESVGRPFPGVRVYVVRDNCTRCEAGEGGEVVHTGLGMMMGYLDSREAGTVPENKLRANPFYGDDDPSPLAIFTGDMGYLDEDGYLFLRGRRDSMVKVMGNRVYPQEVTNQVLTVPDVREAVVAGVTGEDGQTNLVAFVRVSSGSNLTPGMVRKMLNAKLPTFMVPKEIVFVDRVPYTASGKPDHGKLVEGLAANGSRAATALTL